MPQSSTAHKCSFFFSSRRRHTRFDCDWSSDVCSSDLTLGLSGHITRLHSLAELEQYIKAGIPVVTSQSFRADELDGAGYGTSGHLMVIRSEERRVGKECRSRWSPYH